MKDHIMMAYEALSFVAILLVPITLIILHFHRKKFFKQSAFLVARRKKNTFVFKDRRLAYALWSTEVWQIWLIASVVFLIVFAIGALLSSGDDVSTFIGGIYVLVIAILLFLICWYVSEKRFNQQKEKLGVKLEQDEEMIESVAAEYLNPTFGFKYKIFILIMASYHSVMSFLDGRPIFGIFFTILFFCAAYDIIRDLMRKRKEKENQL